MMQTKDNASELISLLSELPGIGPKTAERMAFFLMEAPNRGVAASLASCLLEAAEKTTYCRECFNFTESDTCSICQNPKRLRSIICVVDSPKDLVAIEKGGEYKGSYHVLNNSLYSETDNTLDFLLKRLKRGIVREVIVATSADSHGDFIHSTLSREAPKDIKVSRICIGIPIGASIEFISPETLAKALSNRQQAK
jgi:recombination protein RecR